MPGYYRIIPEYIASHPSLIAEEKLFYFFLSSLMTKYGFCWASNRYLAEESKTSISTVHRYLRKLTKLGLIIIELEYHNERKIWIPETWGNRENLLKVYGAENVMTTENFNQRFYTHVTDDTGGVSRMTPYIIESTNKKEKHIEAWAKPVASKISSPEQGVKKLPSQMKGPPPTPGNAKMVEQTKAFLQSPIRIGSTKFLLSPKDVSWFLGFSETIVAKSIDIANKESKEGKKISQLVPYLYKICCNLRKK